jgi:hypothetical protein
MMSTNPVVLLRLHERLRRYAKPSYLLPRPIREDVIEAADLIEQLQAEKARREWQPIETAPKDGTIILLAPHMMTGWWEFGDDNWQVLHIRLNADGTIANDWSVQPKMVFCLSTDMLGAEPTHWMPLPEPPGQ